MKTLPFIAALLLLGNASQAGIITFDFGGQNGIDLDNLSSGITSATDGTIVLTMSATAVGGVFNHVPSSSNFGVNAPSGDDDSDAFDGGDGPEGMAFTITSSVPLSDLTLVSMEFDRFGSGTDDAGSVALNGLFLGGFALGTFVDTNLSSGVLSLNQSGILPADILTLDHAGTASPGAATQGFGLEFITFNATVATVPEPSSAGLLAFAGICIGLCSRRRNMDIRAS